MAFLLLVYVHVITVLVTDFSYTGENFDNLLFETLISRKLSCAITCG
uniref:Uncharacterized protein n=1 Tax=Anguilla anguilla TaxID=7936 RepID=A0A0E9V8U3_ANGAN